MNNISSNSAIVEHARSGKRHETRDKALVAISRHAGSTSSEIAEYVLSGDGQKCDGLAVIDIVRAGVRVASVQKRVSDLVKLGYIVESSKRKCRVTGHVVAVYEIAEAGRLYLQGAGVSVPRSRSAVDRAAAPAEVKRSDVGRSALSGLRSSLG